MAERFLIDTNILIDFQNGIIPVKELTQIKKIIDDDFIISFITYKLDLPSTLKIHLVFYIFILKPYKEVTKKFE